MKKLFIFVLIVLLSSCTSLNTKPFHDFAGAVRNASEGANKALSINYAWERENFIYDIAIGDEDIYSIFLDRPENFNATFREGVPFFYTLRDVQKVLNQVNEATIKYIDLLIILAGDSAVTKDEFKGYAEDLNKDMNSIIRQLNVNVPGEAIPIFSLGISELVKMIMNEKRKAAITKVLEGNQLIIEAYSKKCIKIIDVAADSLYHSYSKYFSNAEEELFRLKEVEQRKILATKILDFNEQYITIIAALGTTRNIYETLPRAHEALYGSVTKKSLNIQYALDLYKYGEDLERAYEDLKND